MSTFNPLPLPPPDPLTLRLTPRGNLVLAPDADAPALPCAIAQRLVDAFAAGVGPGLFYLGSTQVKQAGAGLPKSKQGPAAGKVLEDAALADVFGIEMDGDAPPPTPAKKLSPKKKVVPAKKPAPKAAKKATPAKTSAAAVAKKTKRQCRRPSRYGLRASSPLW